MSNPTIPAAATGLLREPIFADRNELIDSLRRLCGLVDAIFAIAETCADDEIAEEALYGVQSALKRESEEILATARRGNILLASVAVAAPQEAAGAARVDDSVLAAIERHRHARQQFESACRLVDNVRARNDGRLITAADEATYKAMDAAESVALDDLAKIAVRTLPGLIGALAYLIESSDGKDGLVRFVETAVASAAAT